MHHTQRRVALTWVLVWGIVGAASLAGCGGQEDELPREPVTGSVKFKGQPLKTGMIQFVPAEQGAGTGGGAAIRDGEYAIAQAEGLVPGKYQVLITSAESAPASSTPQLPGDAPPPPKEPIPAKYNSQSTLSAEVQKEKSNKFDFDLKEK